jgi:hypothetical protein
MAHSSRGNYAASTKKREGAGEKGAAKCPHSHELSRGRLLLPRKEQRLLLDAEAAANIKRFFATTNTILKQLAELPKKRSS